MNTKSEYPFSKITADEESKVNNRIATQPDYSRTMRGKEGKKVGFMAELKFLKWCNHVGLDCSLTDTHNDDFDVCGFKVDVKAKQRSVFAKPNYEASVWEFSLTHQQPDYFVFTSQKGSSLVELLGYISYEDFMNKSRAMKKGEDQGNMSIVEDCRNIYHYQLNSMESFIDEICSNSDGA